MMKHLLFVLALFSACATALYTAGPTHRDGVYQRGEALTPTPTKRELTNAERLRRSLPLLPPKRRSGPLAPRASCAPNTFTGKIEVRSFSSGSVLGRVVNWSLSSLNFLGPDSDLLVQVTVPPTGEATEIIPLNDTGASSAFPFYGAGGGTLGPGSPSTAGFGGVNHSPANSPPSSANTESTIWIVDPASYEISVQWTNSGGSQPSTTIAYNIRNNQFFLVGDLAAYNAAFTFPASAVVSTTCRAIVVQSATDPLSCAPSENEISLSGMEDLPPSGRHRLLLTSWEEIYHP
ncbi:hypothetical protein FA13DRAFT_406528 [Coprinellus micaceus]|uniref:Uncharacterized protein n=1 Tax=Coprinellus micaceus TaxID=71717 RepID=A0A4Y7TXS2_COPMI|nr:hypothetical protein FA13DRAFT_406528 [Coprinellus micaceus]